MRTVVRRHGYVLFRSPHRWFDIAFWPVFDVLLFGSLGAFVAQENDASRAATPYLLAGIMLFHVLFQSQIAVATGFMEETWTRNILNVMTTPLREVEYVARPRAHGPAEARRRHGHGEPRRAASSTGSASVRSAGGWCP